MLEKARLDLLLFEPGLQNVELIVIFKVTFCHQPVPDLFRDHEKLTQNLLKRKVSADEKPESDIEPFFVSTQKFHIKFFDVHNKL